jgi:hypothetical protein
MPMKQVLWPPVPGARTQQDEIQDLLECTFSPDVKTRRAALHALCPCALKSNHAEVWERLFAMVNHPDPRVRGDVLHTLCDGSPREREADVVRALEAMYHDPDPRLRRRVRQILASYRAGGKLNVL